jgi:hypothetical protein
MKIVEILRKKYFILVSTFLIIYIQKKNNLSEELRVMEKKIILLTENIDLDYLEILYREKFFFGKSNEDVYINRQNDN